MKRLIFFLLISIILVSCGKNESQPKKPKIDYQYTQMSVVPDSNVVKMREWILKTVEATNRSMTGGDYEDPEDVIEQAEETAKRIFSVKVDALEFLKDGYYHNLPQERMTKEELHIMDSLKFHQR